ncbi:hypothetical protein R8Z50_13690 [Longispora sp. K20-0274]|uniref:hypothetical protein n=1 Tax=Longispora sp. K20-0274 TaxID=3088255 RepID=UPI003999BC52
MRNRLLRLTMAAVLGVGATVGLAATGAYAAPVPAPAGYAAPDPGVAHTDAVAPEATPLPAGQKTRTWTIARYAAAWRKANGREMTDLERDALARGCIGVTTVNIERGNINPPLGLSFGTFDKARAVQDALNAVLADATGRPDYAAQVRRDPLLSTLDNVTSSLPAGDPSQWTAVVFSKRFFSGQDSSWTAEETDRAFRPDARGQVDMTGYHYRAKPGYVNFDYGWYDPATSSWWHANHSEPDMEIYQSTLKYYSRPLLDFDRQVYSVTFARKTVPAWYSSTN